MTLPLNILAPARPSPRSVLQGSEEGCYPRTERTLR